MNSNQKILKRISHLANVAGMIVQELSELQKELGHQPAPASRSRLKAMRKAHYTSLLIKKPRS